VVDHKVVEGFLQALERNGIGVAAQANCFNKLKAILLDANRLGLFDLAGLGIHPDGGEDPPAPHSSLTCSRGPAGVVRLR
jgi:hypothetical protein